METAITIVPLKEIEHGVYGDLVIIYPRPYSIYLGGILYIYIYSGAWA